MRFVLIATGRQIAFPMAKASLLAGSRPYEKPMASSAAECEELAKFARKGKRPGVMTGHTSSISPRSGTDQGESR